MTLRTDKLTPASPDDDLDDIPAPSDQQGLHPEAWVIALLVIGSIANACWWLLS